MNSVPTVVVVTGGEPPPPRVLQALPNSMIVIAADSGLAHARHLGLEVDLLIGDLDSVSAAERSLHPGLREELHSPDKDKTDLELALEQAVSYRPPMVIVVGGAGGRLDHLLANAALLTAPKFAGTPIRWLAGDSETHVVWTATHIDGVPGDLVSLLAYGGPVRGVTTAGLRWPLHGATLESGSTWGMSNELTGSSAEVAVGEGTLLAIHTRGTGPGPQES